MDSEVVDLLRRQSDKIADALDASSGRPRSRHRALIHPHLINPFAALRTIRFARLDAGLFDAGLTDDEIRRRVSVWKARPDGVLLAEAAANGSFYRDDSEGVHRQRLVVICRLQIWHRSLGRTPLEHDDVRGWISFARTNDAVDGYSLLIALAASMSIGDRASARELSKRLLTRRTFFRFWPDLAKIWLKFSKTSSWSAIPVTLLGAGVLATATGDGDW